MGRITPRALQELDHKRTAASDLHELQDPDDMADDLARINQMVEVWIFLESIHGMSFCRSQSLFVLTSSHVPSRTLQCDVSALELQICDFYSSKLR